MRIVRLMSLPVLFVLAALSLVAPAVQAQEPAKAVQPEAAVPGTTFAFFATGLGGNDKYVFWASGPDGTVIGNESYRAVSSRGRADWTWTSPGDAKPGTWLMVLRRAPKTDDSDNDKEKAKREELTISFTVLSADGSAPPPPAPTTVPAGSQGVEPALGTIGTEFAFFATGYTAAEKVGFWVNTPDGKVLSDESNNVLATSDGRADWRWTAPQNALAGAYTMVARGSKSGVERVITFEIR